MAADGSVLVGYAGENSPAGGINRGIGPSCLPYTAAYDDVPCAAAHAILSLTTAACRTLPCPWSLLHPVHDALDSFRHTKPLHRRCDCAAPSGPVCQTADPDCVANRRLRWLVDAGTKPTAHRDHCAVALFYFGIYTVFACLWAVQSEWWASCFRHTCTELLCPRTTENGTAPYSQPRLLGLQIPVLRCVGCVGCVVGVVFTVAVAMGVHGGCCNLAILLSC